MKRKISEFSYGFALTHELVNTYKYLLTDQAPIFPSLVEEGKVGGGYDMYLPRHGQPLFLQFKVSEYLWRTNAKAEEAKAVGRPYFRFTIYRKTQSKQHELLVKLEKGDNEVCYAAPRFHETESLNTAFFDEEIVARSVFISPREIGEIQDNKEHRVVFSNRSEDVYFCSQPKLLETAMNGTQFVRKIDHLISAKRSHSLDEAFFRNLSEQMISIASPNRKLIDELSKGQKRLSSATFANYLAKTLFDCELLVIPAKADAQL